VRGCAPATAPENIHDLPIPASIVLLKREGEKRVEDLRQQASGDAAGNSGMAAAIWARERAQEPGPSPPSAIPHGRFTACRASWPGVAGACR
jgi:hypothetical protein